MKKYIFLFISFIILFWGIIFTIEKSWIRFPKTMILEPTFPKVTGVEISITASSGALRFFESAKKQIGKVTQYDLTNGYYGNGGYPPEDTGVCSDLIWRAYRDVGLDFQKIISEAIQKNPRLYDNDLDSNINYRRVKRLFVYYSNNAKILTNELVPNNRENLATWQPGDIVIFDELPSNHLWHIGIISDERRWDGVPYMVDNHGKWVGITITPLDWPAKIKWHFRPF